MSTYIIIKSIIMALAIIGAFGLFFIRVKRLLSLMQAVQGRTKVQIDRSAERIRVLFTDVLGQSNVRPISWPSWSSWGWPMRCIDVW